MGSGSAARGWDLDICYHGNGGAERYGQLRICLTSITIGISERFSVSEETEFSGKNSVSRQRFEFVRHGLDGISLFAYAEVVIQQCCRGDFEGLDNKKWQQDR